MGLAIEIYRAARAVADERGGGTLESVTVTVGELAAVEPDLLKFAWRGVVDGTLDARACLVVDWRRARQSCRECGEVAERAEGSWLRLCPGCGEPLLVAGGDELDLRRVAYTAPDGASP